jgi:hypothetical protein
VTDVFLVFKKAFAVVALRQDSFPKERVLEKGPIPPKIDEDRAPEIATVVAE